MKLGYALVSSEHSYLVQTGYVDSRLDYSLLDRKQACLPWMNYPLIDFLEEKLNKDMTVFEYGSGYSTLFFAQRTKRVASVEYNSEWYHKVKKMLGEKTSNAQVHYQELNATYPYAIEKQLKGEKCDILVIDGRKRVKCAKIGFDHLSDSGVLIFDDTYRKYYQEGIQFYLDKGFKSIRFKGLKPTGFGTDETIVLYRDNNCLGI